MKQNKIVLNIIIIILFLILIILLYRRNDFIAQDVSIQKTETGDFQLFTGRKPFLLKGMVYNPIPIGENHRFNFWGDTNQPWMEDGRLMKELGVNAVRFFQPGEDVEQTRKVIEDFYRHYGIYSIIGHWMDYWTPGNYADTRYRQDLTRRVLEMVSLYKDARGVLIWVLGNENNLSWHSGAKIGWTCPEVEEIEDPYKQKLARARIYYSLVDEIAREIKEIDPGHLVALGSGDIYTLEIVKDTCPNIDLVAVTSYRGKTFGNLWREIKQKVGKPVLIMEFGCDSFNAKINQEDQEVQALFLKSQWQDIERNTAGFEGEGNALGGCIFEWNDEWWKHDEHGELSWSVHDTEGDWSCGGYYFDISAAGNMNMNEEYWGVVALSEELEKGLNRRIPKKAYYNLQRVWNE